jgi:repressor LexA
MAQDDYRPSIREIAATVGASNQTVMSDLAELVRRGLVADCDVPAGRRQRGKRAARAFVITDLGVAQVQGEMPQPQPVAAGPPSDQPTMTGFDVEVDAGGAFTIPPGHLTVRARGDSMIDAGIEPYDVVVLRQAESAENGQIVLAEVDGTADDGALTLKRIYWEDDQVRLQPANPRRPLGGRRGAAAASAGRRRGSWSPPPPRPTANPLGVRQRRGIPTAPSSLSLLEVIGGRCTD